MSETCSQGRGIDSDCEHHRSWTPEHPLDLRAVLAPLRRGRGDPTMRVDADGTIWRAGTTPAGAATLALRCDHGGTVHATGWGSGGKAGRDLLCKVPGIGIWTAAEVAQRVWADADAVSIGDFHIPSVVGYALVGRPLDDKGMLEILAPYVPQRHRAVRYIEAAGFGRPRFGPRFSPRDYRAI